MLQKIALFGGSFDPVHNGHLIVARSVAECVALERIIFLPSASPPHKQGAALADPSHRAAMVALAIQGETRSASLPCRFEMSDFDLTRRGPSFTIDTIEHFSRTLGNKVEVQWIIGADSLNDLTSWHRVAELVDRCQLLTAARPGSDSIHWASLRTTLNKSQIEKLRRGVLETPRIEISSTDIRSSVHRQQTIVDLVPDSVARYIQEHSLYRTKT